MNRTTTVSGYTRRKPAKPKEYIEKHLALFPRRSDALRFAKLHDIPVISTDDPRLSAPLPKPSHGPGRFSLEQIKAQLAGLASVFRRRG